MISTKSQELGRTERQSPRIAIMNAHWLVHSSIGYMASCLAKAGYLVDIFLYRSDESLSGDLLTRSPSMSIFRMDAGSMATAAGDNSGDRSNQTIPVPMKRGLVNRLSHLLPSKRRAFLVTLYDQILLRVCPEFRIIPEPLIKTIAKRTYAAVIGVEKGGLAWAGPVSVRTRIPLIYYSLELYTWDHPWVASSTRMRRYKLTEEKYHRRSALTIIQDEYRGRALLADNRVNSVMRLAYLPVSVSGPPYRTPSRWLQRELALETEHVLILYYGWICERRLNLEMARVAQQFPEKWRLVLHGYGSPETISTIRAIDESKRVCISLKLVPADRRQDVVRSAQIGLALYRGEILNDRLTGRSSEKIALYFQCGIPTIAFRHESYEHIEAEKAGVLIDRMEELPTAVDRILQDYDCFAANAFSCYQKYYCFEANFETVLSSLHHITCVQ